MTISPPKANALQRDTEAVVERVCDVLLLEGAGSQKELRALLASERADLETFAWRHDVIEQVLARNPYDFARLYHALQTTSVPLAQEHLVHLVLERSRNDFTLGNLAQELQGLTESLTRAELLKFLAPLQDALERYWQRRPRDAALRGDNEPELLGELAARAVPLQKRERHLEIAEMLLQVTLGPWRREIQRDAPDGSGRVLRSLDTVHSTRVLSTAVANFDDDWVVAETAQVLTEMVHSIDHLVLHKYPDHDWAAGLASSLGDRPPVRPVVPLAHALLAQLALKVRKEGLGFIGFVDFLTNNICKDWDVEDIDEVVYRLRRDLLRGPFGWLRDKWLALIGRPPPDRYAVRHRRR